MLMDILAFGAHPDDIEFGCGGVIALEASRGQRVHLVVASLGEAGSHGSPAQRRLEAEKAAALLGATVEFIEFGGDAHFEESVERVLGLAALIRAQRPKLVLAPSLVKNQHPDHAALGSMVRQAARLARYGGLRELHPAPPHAIGQLFFYAVTTEAEPADISPVMIDVTPVLVSWQASMEAHASQTGAREYVELQLTRSRLRGLSAGVAHAMALFPNDPPLIENLATLGRGARRF